MSYSKTEILAAIDALRISTAPLSVAPADLAALLNSLLDYSDETVADGLNKQLNEVLPYKFMRLSAYVNSQTGDLLRWKLPPEILYIDDGRTEAIIAKELEAKKQTIRDWSILPIFNAAMSASYQTYWPNVDPRQVDYSTPLHNGYYPDENPDAPFYICGVWLNQSDMLRVLMDRYTPYTGGIQCSAKVNLPSFVKSTDSALPLDYAAVNNGLTIAIALGGNGWATTIRPTSMRRAFDNCSSLRAIIGEIDMRSIASAWDANSLFNKCSQLWQFHIANVPDVIETLDLSLVSDSILTAWAATDGADKISSLKYLANNFARDVKRTKNLTVKVSKSVFARVSDDLSFSKSGLTWVSA